MRKRAPHQPHKAEQSRAAKGTKDTTLCPNTLMAHDGDCLHLGFAASLAFRSRSSRAFLARGFSNLDRIRSRCFRRRSAASAAAFRSASIFARWAGVISSSSESDDDIGTQLSCSSTAPTTVSATRRYRTTSPVVTHNPKAQHDVTNCLEAVNAQHKVPGRQCPAQPPCLWKHGHEVRFTRRH